ncbi:MAG: hypothetical protein CSA39_03705 [Flavobacteriales bacterium]|nr:MAG: hypothetical protein CR989_01880 [Flavobacteriales bacterium]PIE49238.1 MAG: hypothetical protein CSA39_03705 [Flavobacteriales bacterium]
MKKLILFFCFTLSLSLFAQKEVEEGVMKLKVTMSSENEQVNASLAMIGDLNATTYFKSGKSRTEMSSNMTGSNTTIVDNENKKLLVLMDNPMLGKKYLKQDITNEETPKDVKVTENGETKTILGYDCKGYDLVTTQNGQEQKITMYVTDKIKAPNQNTVAAGDQIKGFPLLAIVTINQMGSPLTTTAEVIEITGEKVDDSKFDLTVPEGYDEMKVPK